MAQQIWSNIFLPAEPFSPVTAGGKSAVCDGVEAGTLACDLIVQLSTFDGC